MRTLLDTLPRHLRGLRGGLDRSRRREVEAALGFALPPAYASFLEIGDGGWLGNLQVYGSPELLALARRPRRAGGQRLLPFHPVDRRGVECFDLTQRSVPVLWCRYGASALLEEAGGDDGRGLPSLLAPTALACWARGPSLVHERTYLDFDDWFLDALCECQG